MYFFIGFILTAITLSAVASPLRPIPGTRIPIAKRNSLVNHDGTANLDLLRRSLKFSVGKILKGFDVYEHNTGTRHPLAVHNNQKRATGADSLIDDAAQLWYGSISIGTPAKTYTVDFDTGSSDLFLPAISCTKNCSGHTRYDPKFSSTSSDRGQTFTLSYGDGSSVSGEQYTDTVAISGLEATKQTLGAASVYSSGFAIDNFPPDGLLGMGFPSISVYGTDPVFQTMVSQRQTSESVFAFKFAQSGSELYLGGVNKALYKGDFTYTSVTTAGYWQVDLEGVEVNGKTPVSQTSSIIDTGTTLIIGSVSQVQAVYADIPGSADASSTVGDGFYTVPCDSIPTLSLTFGGKAFPVSPDTFNSGQVSEGSPLCVGGLAGSSIADNFWIVGDVFLQNVYTKFDIGSLDVGLFARVGFAELA